MHGERSCGGAHGWNIDDSWLAAGELLVRLVLRWGVGTGFVRDGVGVETHCWVLREQPHGWCVPERSCRAGLGCLFAGGPGWWWCGRGPRVLHNGPCPSSGGWGCRWGLAGGGPGRCLRTAQWTRASLFSVVEVFKGTGWMPWHQEPKKDVVACDMPRGVGKRTVIRGCPNGETPHQSCGATPA